MEDQWSWLATFSFYSYTFADSFLAKLQNRLFTAPVTSANSSRVRRQPFSQDARFCIELLPRLCCGLLVGDNGLVSHGAMRGGAPCLVLHTAPPSGSKSPGRIPQRPGFTLEPVRLAVFPECTLGDLWREMPPICGDSSDRQRFVDTVFCAGPDRDGGESVDNGSR